MFNCRFPLRLGHRIQCSYCSYYISIAHINRFAINLKLSRKNIPHRIITQLSIRCS